MANRLGVTLQDYARQKVAPTGGRLEMTQATKTSRNTRASATRKKALGTSTRRLDIP